MDFKERFKNFFKAYPYLQMQEAIEFFSVFGDFNESLEPDLGLMQNIEKIYLQNFHDKKRDFIYADDECLQKMIEKALKRLSRGDRKRLSIYKDLSQSNGRLVYRLLYQKGIITKELSRERPLRLGKKFIKKESRSYKVDSKINFTNEADRFWFNFIAPNFSQIEKGDFKEVLRQIDKHFLKHISLCFENLSIELIKDVFKTNAVNSSGSFWYKKSEIDLLVYTKNGDLVMGEAKWKNGITCKNVLNLLEKKAEQIGVKPTHFVIFSKSGFSKELIKMRSNKVLLFELEDFKRILHKTRD